MSTPIAFVFPGQGSQFPGMGRDLEHFGPGAGEFAARAEEITGVPVMELMTTADADTLADPEIAQVLVFVWSCAALARLLEHGWRPSVVAGHSLGEYSALVACGSLDVDTALSLVSCRGKAMVQAARQSPGAMAAVVGLPLHTVEALCEQARDNTDFAVVANVNSPRQTVVSGTTQAVRAVTDAARQAGALRAKQLPVGGAYHSPLMAGATKRLADKLSHIRLRPPGTPLVSSATGQLVTDIAEYRAELLLQVVRPVRWEQAMRTLIGLGARAFVEVGPGRVLGGLGREMARVADHLTSGQALRAAPPAAYGLDSRGTGRISPIRFSSNREWSM
ncbi:ACP S-malonyltransferase [Streptomyces sp. NPDC054933]